MKPYKKQRYLAPLFICLTTLAMAASGQSVPAKPNVLLIMSDDLRNWLGCYGDSQAHTPNLDRLAARGVVFKQAACVASLCNPSRTALITGMRPSATGVYANTVLWSDAVPDAMTLPLLFKNNGYYVSGAGKITHGTDDTVRQSDWNDYGAVGAEAITGPNPQSVDKWSWVIPDRDQDNPDYANTSYIVTRLKTPQSKPFFLACGIHRPHTNWDVPQKYFDMNPLDQIQQPPIKANDLNDIPPMGQQMANRNSSLTVLAIPGGLEKIIQAYRASISFMDAQVGRLLDTLDASPAKDNTIIVFCGDNGWHFGEKRHMTKITLWKEAVNVPLIWVVPGMTQPGTSCDRPVDLLSIFPTLCDLTGVPLPAQCTGPSLRPLLADPQATWNYPAMCTMYRGRHSLTDDRYRYIRYSDGTEELYDHATDPNEWTNIANDPQSASIKDRFITFLPTYEAPDKGDQITYTSAGTGPLMDSSKWSPAAIPVDEDANEWLIDNATHTRTATAAEPIFYGQTLTLQAGTLRPFHATGGTLTMNNLVLSGGTIKAHTLSGESGNFIIDFNQYETAGTFTLMSGIIKTETNALSRVTFRNGALAGSGTITISAADGSAPTSRVVFENTMSTEGFTGVFDVTSGRLELQTISATNASFGLTINGGKLYNTADIAVVNLVLGTSSIPNGTYTAADLVAMNAAYADAFAFPASTSNSITVATGSRQYTSTGTGSLNDSAKWSSGTAPVDGDANEWLVNNAAHIRTAGAGALFYGQTLIVQAGKVRPVSTAAASLTMNNLVLSGGTITTRESSSTGSFTIDLGQDGSAGTFTLNGGNLRNADLDGSNLIFRNGVLAGSGTINIEKTVAAATTRVVFDNTISTVGFTGVFEITSGSLELPTISAAKASFGLKMNGGKLYNNTAIAVKSLTIAGHVFPAGTYTYSNIGAAYQPYIGNNGGSITVVANAPQPPEDPYLVWSSSHNLGSEIGKTDDSDGDGVVNLVEYALGGNPTNDIDVGHKPTLSMGATGIDYVHVERNGTNIGIAYIVEVSDSLIAPNWTTSGIQIVRGLLDSDFNLVTNRISPVIKTNQFIRLIIK